MNKKIAQLTIIASVTLHAMQPGVIQRSKPVQMRLMDRIALLCLYRKKTEESVDKNVRNDTQESRIHRSGKSYKREELYSKPRRITWGNYIFPKNEDGSLATLHAAVIAAKPFEIEKFIKSGVDINEKDQYGYTALHYAIAADAHWHIVDLLCENNANLNIIGANGVTPHDLLNAELKMIGIERFKRLHNLAYKQALEREKLTNK